MRTVVVHYHLFKNAGSSIDAALKSQLRWVTREFADDRAANAAGMAAWIQEQSEAQVFSTHTGQLPVPVIDGVAVVPVIFARHPLDRIASAYTFERTQGDPGFGSTLARHTTLAGYVETRLSIAGDRQCRNFQTSRFAAMFTDDRAEIERALEAVETLPFVGVVESYDESLGLLQELLGERGFPGLNLVAQRHNASGRTPGDISDRLSALEAEVGADVWARLLEVNADDLALWEAARLRLGAPSDAGGALSRPWWRRSARRPGD